MKSALV